MLTENGYLGGLYFGANTLTGDEDSIAFTASILGRAASDWTSGSSYPTELVFRTGSAAISANSTSAEPGSVRMVIGSTGDVGIGTASPTSRLHVWDSTDITPDGSSVGHIQISGSGYAGCLALDATGMWMSQNSSSRALIFATNETERMRVSGAGNVGIGNINPAYPLDVLSTAANTAAKIGNSDTTVTGSNVLMRLAFTADANCTNGYFMTFQDSAASIGSVQCASTSTVVFNTTSDYRLKENITDLTGALATVNALRPVTFNFIRDEEGIEHKGFLAHEVAEVAPRAVTGEKDATRVVPAVEARPAVTDDDGNELEPAVEAQAEYEEINPQMIDPSKLVAIMAGAIQELTARIETLETV
jgi:hypothetical protein